MARKRKQSASADQIDRIVVERFDSMSAFGRGIANLPPCDGYDRCDEWSGNMKLAQAHAALWQGCDEAVVRRAERLLQQIDDFCPELPGGVWDAGVCGVMPLVPAYLAGSPVCMLARQETMTTASPVRVFASVCASAGLSASELESRGVAILALCRKLSAVRPVELHLFAEMGDSGIGLFPTIQLDTSPLDLPTATYALTHPAFLRKLCFAWAGQHQWQGRWAWGMSPSSQQAQAKTREALGLEEQDLLIPGAFNNDKNVRKPVEWVNEQLARYAA